MKAGILDGMSMGTQVGIKLGVTKIEKQQPNYTHIQKQKMKSVKMKSVKMKRSSQIAIDHENYALQVGMNDGMIEGISDGSLVGMKDGISVGTKVGEIEGRLVGT